MCSMNVSISLDLSADKLLMVNLAPIHNSLSSALDQSIAFLSLWQIKQNRFFVGLNKIDFFIIRQKFLTNKILSLESEEQIFW